MSAIDPQSLIERYIGLWNEPDPETRRKTVHALWAEDGRHVLLPPRTMHDEAVGLGFATAVLEARGHEELYARVARAYEEFVAPGTYVFRVREAPRLLRDVVTFRWESFHQEEGRATGGGLEFLVLDGDGRIARDYQFVD
ncbi:hypothetical protein [Streptomyces olivochromogenes]|uniref:hypothetical protein n=1 Tax=Streptomyces olivochromogenes TaxID=1963 RepID=UPI001F35EBE3|nr:hypothetical protein [Streptomyces olivochromogenes]MCF3135900.1 hypothetical protein [Streptomyces olivochromogenes]